MSFELVDKVLDSGITDPTGIRVLVAIAKVINSSTKSWRISLSDLSRLSRTSPNSLAKSLKKYEDEGILLIKREKAPNKRNLNLTNVYSINVEILDQKYPSKVFDRGNLKNEGTLKNEVTSNLKVGSPKNEGRGSLKFEGDISNDKEDISKSLPNPTSTPMQTLPSSGTMGRDGRLSSESLSLHYQGNTEERTEEKPKKGCPPCPVEKMVALFAKVLPELPTPVGIHPARRANIKARWRESYADGDFQTEEEGLQVFASFFNKKIRSSNFLMGKKTSFIATIDFVFNPENFFNIIEGTYADRENNQYQ